MDSAQTLGGQPMTEPDGLGGAFERLRPYLVSVGYSMLGSVSDAEDAVQESWLRLRRSNPSEIGDLRAWLTTVVGRICLDTLKARRARREDQAGMWLPEPLVAEPDADGPEDQTVIAESIGLALLIVLESLTPPERLAFVMHDVFAVPFDNIGPILGRTPEAARQLASRARRRVQAAPQPDPDLPAQHRAVDAFLAAARHGDFAGLLELLAPDVVLRFEPEPGTIAAFEITGADAVARHILRTARLFDFTLSGQDTAELDRLDRTSGTSLALEGTSGGDPPARQATFDPRYQGCVVGPGLVSPNGGRPAFGAGGQLGVPSAYQAGVLERGAGELYRRGARVGGGADVVPVQDVLAQGLVPAGGGRGQAGARKAGRRRVREGEERRLRVAGIARPPAGLDQLGVRCIAHDEVIGGRVGGQAGEQEHRQVKSAPPRVYR